MRNRPTKKQQGIYQIYGINGTSNIIQEKKLTIIRVDIMHGGAAEKKKWIQQLGKNKALPVHRLPKDQFLNKYKGKRTQGIVVNFQGGVFGNMPSFAKSDNLECLLALDSLEDPQNLGQIIRTAECSNISGILLPEYQSVQVTDTVLQVSQGAFIHIPLFKCGNLHQQLRKLMCLKSFF